MWHCDVDMAKVMRKKPRIRLGAELRREQILKQATDIISTRGFNGFGIQELAQRCGITKGALLYYFGSKDGLLLALLQHRVSRDTASLYLRNRGADLRIAKSLDSTIKVLRTIVELNCSQPEIVRFWSILRAEALSKGHPAGEFFRAREADTRKRFAAMLSRHVAQADSTARLLLGLMAGLEDQWLREEQSFDLLREWDRGVAKVLSIRSNTMSIKTQ
jgi:AcrR family transcriptional regulator